MNHVSAIVGLPDEDETDQNGSKLFWSPKMTKLLIKTFGDMEYEYLDDKTRRTTFWNNMCTLMHAYGYNFLTSKNCKDKWGSLKRQYGLERRSQNASGGVKSDWSYYQEMHEILKGKPEYQPPSLASNISGVKYLKKNKNMNQKPICKTATTVQIQTASSISKKRSLEDEAFNTADGKKFVASMKDREIKKRNRVTSRVESKIDEMQQSNEERYERTFQQRQSFLDILKNIAENLKK